MIELEEVTNSDADIELLFKQLMNRKYSISHKKMPPYSEHDFFVKNHPYRKWFFVNQDEKILGNVYIQYDNSIGLNLIDSISKLQLENIIIAIISQVDPLPEIPSIRFGKFFFNIPTSNAVLQELLLKIGCQESQRTFVFEEVVSSLGRKES